jgi:hypothetical protein
VTTLAATPDAPTPEEWRRLYEAALAYREREPWRFLSDADLFGVLDPASGEIGWCSVFGAAGQVFGLFVHAGSQGLATCLRMMQDDFDPEELPYIQDGWLATFEDRAGLDARDLATIRALGLKFRGRRAWPCFRSHRPGYLPWHLTGVEARALTEALTQAAGVATRFSDNAAALGPDSTGRFLVRVPEPDGSGMRWEDRRLAPPRVPAAPPASPIDQGRVDRVRQATTPGAAAWECDAFYSPAVIDSGQGRPFFAPAVLIVDRGSGMILDAQFGEPPIGPGLVQDRVLAAMTTLRSRPRAIATQAERVHEALVPLAGRLGIRLERARALPTLAAARRSMFDFFQRGR